MEKVIVRKAAIGDFEIVAELFTDELNYHIVLLPERFQYAEPVISEEWYQELLNNPSKSLFVAERDGLVIGLLYLIMKPAPDDPIFKPQIVAYIEEVAVAREFRGRGVGRQLMDWVREWAQIRGADAIELDVWEQNKGAINFYEKLGYKIIRRKMRYIL